MWFDYPVHREDTVGVLKDCEVEDIAPIGKRISARRRPMKTAARSARRALKQLSAVCRRTAKCRISELAEYIGKSEKTVGRYLKEHGGFWIEEGECGLKAQ